MLVKPTHSNDFMLSNHRFQCQTVELNPGELFNVIDIKGGSEDLEMPEVKLKTVKAKWCNNNDVKLAYL